MNKPDTNNTASPVANSPQPPDLPGLTPQALAIVTQAVDLLRRRYGDNAVIGLSGSAGSRVGDGFSDIDFRVYALDADSHKEDATNVTTLDQAACDSAWKKLEEDAARQQIELDMPWARNVAEIHDALDTCLRGEAVYPGIVWTIWGYELPYEIVTLRVLRDPLDTIAGLRGRLVPYPDAYRSLQLRQARRHLEYWRHDPHYQNKGRRGDVVFCAALASKLVHQLLRYLFALNREYYPGDGHNLKRLAKLALLPCDADARIEEILASSARHLLAQQHQLLVSLIDETLLIPVSSD